MSVDLVLKWLAVSMLWAPLSLMAEDRPLVDPSVLFRKCIRAVETAANWPLWDQTARGEVRRLRSMVDAITSSPREDGLEWWSHSKQCGERAETLAKALVRRGLSVNLVEVATDEKIPFWGKSTYAPDLSEISLQIFGNWMPVRIHIHYAVHVFITYRTLAGTVIIDPTWKQCFLNREALRTEPDIFVGTVAKLRHLFIKYQDELFHVFDERDEFRLPAFPQAMKGTFDPVRYFDKFYGMGPVRWQLKSENVPSLVFFEIDRPGTIFIATPDVILSP